MINYFPHPAFTFPPCDAKHKINLFRPKLCHGKERVKIHRVPGPGPSTGGRRLYFEKKNRGAETFCRKKCRGAETFFEKKSAPPYIFFRQKVCAPLSMVPARVHDEF